jgi:putative transcriptional regulator
MRSGRDGLSGGGVRLRVIVGALVAIALLAGGALAASTTGWAQDAPPEESLAGRLLVATPEMADPRFAQSVLLVIEHDADGAFGLIVNRPEGAVRWQELLDRLDLDAEGVEGRETLHYGGPVEPGRLFLLHSDDVTTPASREVHEGIALTSGGELLRRAAEGDGPAMIRVILGYAGWAPGQLDNEMERGDWFTIPVDPDLIFTDDPGEAWEKARERRPIDL